MAGSKLCGLEGKPGSWLTGCRVLPEWWAVALRALLNLLTEQTPGWIWSPFGDHRQNWSFSFLMFFSAFPVPGPFQNGSLGFGDPALTCAWEVTFPQIGALKLQVASRWLPVAH